eukprot:2217721-Amphidinium_carterae.1
MALALTWLVATGFNYGLAPIATTHAILFGVWGLQRVCGHRGQWIGRAQDPPFLFDAALVFLMVMETWVMTIIVLALSSTGDGAAGACL